MAKENHTLTIAPDGSVTLAVSGVKGKKCTALTDDLERALGTTTNRTPTSEYHEQEQSNNINRQ